MKQLFFYDVLGAARGEGAILLVLDLLTQKGHRTVEVMEGEVVNPMDDVIPMPPVAGPVGARGEEPMHNREEDGPFYLEAELPPREEAMKDSVDPHLFPKPLEDEGRADLLRLGMEAVIPVGQKEEHTSRRSGKGNESGFLSAPLARNSSTRPTVAMTRCVIFLDTSSI